jgi:glycosyltransferase involved in cell wall biosynthesis
MAVPATTLDPALRRIAFICPSGSPMRQLRDLLFAEALSHGHRILVVAPEFSSADVRVLDDLGAEHAVLAPETRGPKLFADWKAIGALKQALEHWAPSAVVACGGQAMVHGALAAKAIGVPQIVLIIDGLPELRFVGALAADEMPAWRYGQALRAASEAVFHNHDDLALMKKLGLVPASLNVSVLPGSGADTEGHPQLPLPPLGQGLVFLMIGGLDRRRGVMDYCAAAAKLRERSPTSRFMLAVLPDEGAQAIDMAELASYADVEFLGFADKHSEFLKEAHIFVYPGYAEGMPQPLLWALACGRPIVTTNVAGCREVVDERVNGCLAEPRHADALAEAMESFLRRPDLIPAMARASRGKAERLESSASVRNSWLNLLHLT